MLYLEHKTYLYDLSFGDHSPDIIKFPVVHNEIRDYVKIEQKGR